MGKIWQKNYDLNALIETFTVGNDYILDRELVTSDCLGSMAHGKMLCAIGILQDEEYTKLHAELQAIMADHAKDLFPITLTDEDVHTAIENRLIRRLGETGKKIHTGRSRNDQVIMAMRIYLREWIFRIALSTADLIEVLLDFACKHEMVPMPGRTHMQTAMPSSIGLWAGAWAEEMLDNLRVLWSLYPIINTSPLGSAASYGVPLPLDREMVAGCLAFDAVQNNVLYVNNSRTKLASFLLDALDHTGITLSRIAQDLILFSLPEFGYFRLPDNLCSGSSIMPQKKNPDVLELMRAKSATLSSCAIHVKEVLRSLPSGYNRDVQETKESIFRALKTAEASLNITHFTFTQLSVDERNLRAAFKPDIYATDAALEKVQSGMSFRDAYREIGLNLDQLKEYNPDDILKKRTSSGTSGNLRLNIPTEQCEKLKELIILEQKKVHKSITELSKTAVDVLRKET